MAYVTKEVNRSLSAATKIHMLDYTPGFHFFAPKHVSFLISNFIHFELN